MRYRTRLRSGSAPTKLASAVLALMTAVLPSCARTADTAPSVENPLDEACRQLEEVQFLLWWIEGDTISALKRSGGSDLDPALVFQEMTASRLGDDLTPYLVLRLRDAGYHTIADKVTDIAVLIIPLQNFSFHIWSNYYPDRVQAAQASVDEIHTAVLDAMHAILTKDPDAACPPGAASP